MKKFFEFYNWCVDKMVKKIFAVVGSALLFLLIIGASSAADIDINNDGTFSDVQNGINQARSGDTIYLNNHTFTGSGSEISVAGGWFSNKDEITIDGSINPNKGGTGNEMSTLDAKSSSRVFNIGASSITLKNIIITNGKYSGRDAMVLVFTVQVLILFWKTVLSVTVKHHLAQEEMFILHYIQKIQ